MPKALTEGENEVSLVTKKALNESSHNRCRSGFGLKGSCRKQRVPGTRVGTQNVSQSPGTRSGPSGVPDLGIPFYDAYGARVVREDSKRFPG